MMRISGRTAGSRLVTGAMGAVVLLASCSNTGAQGSTASATEPTTTTTPAADTPERSPLDGVYEAHLTSEDAVAMGIPGPVRQDIADTYWTMNLSFEYAQMHYAHVDGQGFCCDGFIGDFEVRGRRLVLTDQDGSITLRWRREGRSVTFSLVGDALQGRDRAIDEYIFTSTPWVKTGS